MRSSSSYRSGIPAGVRIAMWSLAIALAAFEVIAYRQLMNPDGLSYLDAARAFAVGDFATALSPHWGPLFPAAVGLAYRLTSPGVGALIPVAHAVNLVLFVIALAAFDFFLRELLRDREGPVATPALFGFAVFIYTTLALIDVRLVTPDLAVAASAFGASALLLRMRRHGVTTGTAVALGAVLAAGYFAKSVMFVLGVAFIGGIVFLPDAGARRWRGIAVAGVVFFALASVLVILFSRKVGTPTFGTAGKLAYNWEVNHVPYTNWQGDARSHLLHPPRQVRTSPDLFEYSEHLQGTYPPWFDPAYWTAGAATTFQVRNQLAQFHKSASFYVDLFFGSVGAVLTLLLLLSWRGARDYLALLLPAAAALAVYLPVHLEPRYVAPFVALLWIVPVTATATSTSTTGDYGRLIGRAMQLTALILIVPLALQAVSHVTQRQARSPHPVVAAELRRLGIVPGDAVANIGGVKDENFGSSFEAYWAYLAGVRIVAEIPERRDAVCRDAAFTDRLMADLAATGARAVVTRAIPATACTAGWRPIKGTDFYVRLLPRGAPTLPDPK